MIKFVPGSSSILFTTWLCALAPCGALLAVPVPASVAVDVNNESALLKTFHGQIAGIGSDGSGGASLAIEPKNPKDEADDVHAVGGCLLLSIFMALLFALGLRSEQESPAGFSSNPQDEEHAEPVATVSTTAGRISSAVAVYSVTVLNLAYGFAAASQGLLIIPLEAERLFPSQSSLAVGACFVLIGFAQLVGPEAGHQSDAYRSKLGRRRPMLIIWVPFLCAATFGLWLCSRLHMGILYCVVFFVQQVIWNIVLSTQAGLVPDLVAEDRQGFAGGASAANILAGATLGFYSMRVLSSWDYHTMYAVISGLSVAAATVVCVVANEESTSIIDGKSNRHAYVAGDLASSGSWLSKFASHYSLDCRQYPDFATLLVTKTLYSASMVVKGFLLFFLQDTFRSKGIADDERLMSNVSIAAEATAVLAALCVMTTAHSERGIKAQMSTCAGAAWMGFLWFGPAYLRMAFDPSSPHGKFKFAQEASSTAWMNWMVTGTALWGIGQGLYLAGDQALQLALLPDPDQASRYLGLTSVCHCIGAVFGGTISGSLLAVLGSQPSDGARYGTAGYVAIFVFAASLSFAISTIAAGIKVPKHSAEAGA